MKLGLGKRVSYILISSVAFLLFIYYSWGKWLNMLLIFAVVMIAGFLIFSLGQFSFKRLQKDLLKEIEEVTALTGEEEDLKERTKKIRANLREQEQRLNRISKGISKRENPLSPAFILLCIPLLFSIVSFFGKVSASAQIQYLVPNTNPECVILYSTSDKAICFKFDRIKKEVLPEYRVIYLQDNQDIEFKSENIGPLHLKPTPTPTQTPTLTPTVTYTPLPTQIPTETPISSP